MRYDCELIDALMDASNPSVPDDVQALRAFRAAPPSPLSEWMASEAWRQPPPKGVMRGRVYSTRLVSYVVSVRNTAVSGAIKTVEATEHPQAAATRNAPSE